MIRRTDSRLIRPERLSTACGLSTTLVVNLLLQSMLVSAARPLAGSGAPLQDKGDVRALALGVQVEREIAGGKSHTYEFNVNSGEYVHVVVDQRGVDLVVTLLGPDGRRLAEVDDEGFVQGTERIYLIAEASGDYRLEMRPRMKDAAGGHYEIRIEEQRLATPQDRRRAAAQNVYWEAQTLRQGAAESRREAVEKYSEALTVWRALGDRQKEAHTLHNLGLTHSLLGESQKALDYYNQALPLLRAVGERRWEASTLNRIGAVCIARDENQKALQFLNQAVSLSRDVGDRALEALALYNIGKAHSLLGQNEEALSYYGQALPLQHALGDRQGGATTLNSTGIAYRLLAEWPKALDQYSQALQLWRAANDRRGEAITLGNIGNIHHEMGEYQKAQNYHHQALPLHRASNNRQAESSVLNSIGWTHWLLGENQKALDYYNQALPIARSIADRGLEGVVLNNIGLAHAALGRKQEALDYYTQALALKRAVEDRWGEAYALLDIGVAHWSLGEHRKALEYYDQALLLKRAVHDRQGEGETLSNIGLAYSSLGEPGKALEHYDQALRLQRAIGDRKNEATTQLGIARAHRDLGNLIEARAHAEAALDIIETLRTTVASQDLRASFLASYRNAYELYIDLLMRLHQAQPTDAYVAQALLASERARARSLLETLTEAHADVRQGVDPLLLQRERDSQQQVNAKAERLTGLLGGKHTEEQASAAKKEMESLLAEYQQVQAQIRVNSPRYAALTQPQPLTVEEIQTEVLDQDSLLLEYSLGDERSFLWAVTPNSISSYVLPKRAEVEQAARGVYGLLIARNQHLADETPERRATRVHQAEAEFRKIAADLSQVLLGPVAIRLAAKRLIIVSEGALQYVPFGALPVPASLESGSASQKGKEAGLPLIAKHEIVTLPSASVLAVLRRELKGRPPAPKAVAVLADPVFRGDDPRIRPDRARVIPDRDRVQHGTASAKGDGDVASDVTRSAGESGLADFRRLRFSRQEAQAIAALVPAEKSLQAVDFTANRATATSPEMGHYSIVHIATHGLLNNQHPELSGVVLSLVDEAGLPQDGFLRLHEIYNLKLGADLVVLSACRTALGREIKGEGLVGLTRGFMYAGSPRVVASLWSVDDRATAELMKRFYTGLLRGGERPAAALRAAQVSMWKDRRWQSPYFWAGFVMQGEWR
ncbi:MAG: tetratricopeptide repeat protein [Acidobacteria bacterium]|nr:tetratricopeptide repeat protein [Acidobacteriota bacterium]MCI0719043.1 tetratricopeptide repeat protein [Acidobacteriota bacterium]